MLLSQTSQYAIAGVLRLAGLPDDGFCRIDDLVAGTPAPRHAVAKVFQELARRGLLDSVRGSGGGFRMSLGAREFTLMDVIEAVDGPWDRAVVRERGLCLPDRPCPLSQVLRPINEHLEQVLRSTRVRDLVQGPGTDTRPCCPRGDRDVAPAVASGVPTLRPREPRAEEQK